MLDVLNLVVPAIPIVILDSDTVLAWQYKYSDLQVY